MQRLIVKSLGLLSLLIVMGCATQFRNHGYVPSEEVLKQLTVGVDTRATVDELVGAPSTSGVLTDGDYYYVRSRVAAKGAFRPQVVDRQVLAISFNPNNTIRNIERFGLEDGQVVPLTRRVTDSSVVGNGFLRQVFGNIGALDPTSLFGG
ncbi:MAG: outer membrane protein assembly factor BamE [Pseudomonadota bacterium]